MDDGSAEELHPVDEDQRSYILVTGTNSGLGLGICQRLIDQFIASRPSYQSLTLIITTRSPKKSSDTVNGLQKYIRQKSKALETALSTRITIQPESVDLSSLDTVVQLADRLCKSIPHLDAVILNAGYAGILGLDWPQAIWSVLTQLVQATTYPTYKLGSIGETTASQKQISSSSPSDNASHNAPPLGMVFTSNVLGHYMLCHLLTPVLASAPENGRIIFTSSVEAYPSSFSVEDLQGLKTDQAYESSKRLSDLLVLTSHLPTTKPFTSRFLSAPTISTPPRGIQLHDNAPVSSSASLQKKIQLADHTNDDSHAGRRPGIYLSHPGIVATAIVPLPLILHYAMLAVAYLARWLGSPWHNITPYKGANAPVWLALASREEIEDEEIEGGKGKWGSACDWLGRERVIRTAVGGWGGGGRVGEAKLESARGRGEVAVVTREAREEFEEVGRRCWKEMEELRVFWEGWVRGEE